MRHLAALSEEVERMLVDLEDIGGLVKGQEFRLHKRFFGRAPGTIKLILG